jgi:3',5'-cyclic AMP phosphodiesterase CpdA
MRLWILSDLHIESCQWDLPEPRPDYDVLVAAGDIHCPATAAATWLAVRAGGRPVIYVPGNHEWYAQRLPFTVEEESRRARAAAEAAGIHLLMDQAVVLEGVRFLGTPLWTDYALDGDPERAMAIADLGMTDHMLIRLEPGSGRFRPEQALAWHRRARAWLERELKRPARGAWTKTVVVTHHLPHPGSVAAEFAGSPLNPAFASDLSALVEGSGAALWVHGHTHVGCDYRAGFARVVCNPKGYGPPTWGGPVENPSFDPELVVEV